MNNRPPKIASPWWWFRRGLFPRLIAMIVLAAFSLSWGTPPPKLRAMQSGSFRNDRLLVQPKATAGKQELTRFHAQNHCEVVRAFSRFGGLQILRLPPGESAIDLADRYRNSGLVEYAEPDYRIRIASVFPNDPSFLDGTQWALNNAGQNGGFANADIDAPEAWSARTCASNVIVAVVDTGIRYTHEDLAGNMWTNPVDSSHGTNAVAGTTDPDDDNSHGTRIAGIIGAMGNNGTGVVGVAWQVQLMACKFADQFGGGTVSDAVACLDYAQANGAHVINASWGLDEFSQSLADAMAALREAGILVSAASGNDSRDIDAVPRYPASFDFDNILSVAATTRQDTLYSLSNVGPTNVDIGAPGYEIYSTDYASNSAYALDEGTSMAAAFASGAAALLRAAHPAETPAQIVGRLLASADPLPALLSNCVSGGRLNLRKALEVAVSPPFLSASVAPGDAFLLQLSGDPGRTYVIETSTNLQQWSAASTNLTDLGGLFLLTNIFGGTPPAQFYRAHLQP